MKYKNTSLDVTSHHIIIENPDPTLQPNSVPSITFHRSAYATIDGIKVASAINPTPARLEYNSATADLEFDELDLITELPTGKKLKYSDIYRSLKSVFAYATKRQDELDEQAIIEENLRKQAQIQLLQESLGKLNG